MTWYITTAPNDLEYAVRVIRGQLIELFSLDGFNGPRIITRKQAKDMGYSSCRRATEQEAARCERRFEQYMATSKANHAASIIMRGWYEVEHNGVTVWAREGDNGRCECVHPDGSASYYTNDELVPVRRVNTEDAEAAARNAYLLRAQARLGAYVDAGRAAKRAATAHVGAGPATSLGPRSYVEEYERSINQLSRRTGRRMSAWS